MKVKLWLQFTLLLMVLRITMSEGFFFEYPKKVLMDFLHSIKEKKEAKKKPEIHHYHMHYYPIVHASEPAVKAPKKHELEEIYNEHLATLGWSNHEYQYIPEPKITISSTLSDLWKDALLWEHGILDDEHFQTVKHSDNEGIYVQIPVNQKIIIEHPHSDKKLKNTLLSNLFHKILDSKNSIHTLKEF